MDYWAPKFRSLRYIVGAQGGVRAVSQIAIIGKQFGRYAGIGVVGTAVHYSVMAFLVEALRSGVVSSATFGFVLGALVNYVLNRRFTFTSDARHRIALPKYLTVATVCLAV